MIEQVLDRYINLIQKPARYIGNEINSVHKDKKQVFLRFAMCFPDVYEIAMSHLGIKILYSLLNEQEDIWCERAFSPWVDFEKILQEEKIPLFALESGDPLKDFDILGFTLQYELSYSNILKMLDLSGIPLLSHDRTSLAPLIIGGGPCAYNAEPIADFFDLFVIGEGEEVTVTLVDLYKRCKRDNTSKEDFLREASQIDGVYVPSLYDVSYKDDGTIRAITPKYTDVKPRVKKVIIKDLDHTFYPDRFVVPNIDVVHDRVMAEIFRGCIRGCRFCQAGMIYRPVRFKSPDVINKQAKTLQETSGYEEISLASLSTSDYPNLSGLITQLLFWTKPKNTNISLPSLRVDQFDPSIVSKIQEFRKSSLTFAPEAGSQRLRDAINKNVFEEDLQKTLSIAFNSGYTSIKLYFMIGLPTETMEDVEEIANLAYRALDVYYACENRNKRKTPHITVSASSFVPKPFTPFQWESQDRVETIMQKQAFLKSKIHSRKIAFNWHDAKTSYLEAVFARGDRRLSQVLIKAVEKGCHFDGWDEYFHFDRYMEAFVECGLDPAFYANRERDDDEIFPWDVIDCGVEKSFLRKERDRAYQNQTSPNCREACLACGAGSLVEGACM